MPTTYSYPGVYVEEIQPLARPIAGVSTSTAGFIGVAERHTHRCPKRRKAQKTTKKYYKIPCEEAEACDKLGRIPPVLRKVWPKNKYLALAVYGFFNNGGTRCYVARIANADDDVNDLESCLSRIRRRSTRSRSWPRLCFAGPLQRAISADVALQQATPTNQSHFEAAREHHELNTPIGKREDVDEGEN